MKSGLMGPGMCVEAAKLALGKGKGNFLAQQGSHGSTTHFTHTKTLSRSATSAAKSRYGMSVLIQKAPLCGTSI